MSPPAGAIPLILTVQTEDEPPFTVEGINDSETNTGGKTVRVADLVLPFRDAEIVTAVWVVTPSVFTAKVEDDFPAGIVTAPRTVATPDDEPIVSFNPPTGADPVRETVPTVADPPVKLASLRVTPDNAGGKIVSEVPLLLVFVLPVMETRVVLPTAVVLTANVAVN